MTRILLSLILTLAPLCSMRAQILLPILAGPPPSGANTPTLISSTCQVLGGTGGTTTSINTTGANFIVGVQFFYAPSTGVAIVNDNKGNGNATRLADHNVSGDTDANIFYFTNPTVGTGHTFSFGASFSAACVFAFSGMQTTSVFDTGTDSGAGPGTASCTVGSITLSGNDLLITGAAVGAAGTFPSAPSGFTAEPNVGGINFTGGVNYGGAAAYRSQNGGTSNPTWTTPGNSACAIAGFKIM